MFALGLHHATRSSHVDVRFWEIGAIDCWWVAYINLEIALHASSSHAVTNPREHDGVSQVLDINDPSDQNATV